MQDWILGQNRGIRCCSQRPPETLVKDGAKIQSVTILSSDVNVSEEVHVQNTIVLPHKDIKNDVVNEVIM